MFTRLRPLTTAKIPVGSAHCHRSFWSLFSKSESPAQPPTPELDHIDLTDGKPRSYRDVEGFQEQLRDEHLDYKSNWKRVGYSPPHPKLITFESTPTITLGRRQEAPAGEPELSRLLKPVNLSLPRHGQQSETSYDVECVKSSRGGLTTYHGPGQLVCWPVLDMISPEYPRYTVSSYATHLESVTQRVLHDLYGIETFTSAEDPGVWVQSMSGQPLKIAALGVHHRRYITSYGIAINIDIVVKGDESRNVWSRFVPCGLEGRGVTSVEDQIGSQKLGAVNMPQIAQYWTQTFKEGLSNPEKRVWNSSPRKVGETQPSTMQDSAVAGAGMLATDSFLHQQVENQTSGGPTDEGVPQDTPKQDTPKDLPKEDPFEPDDLGGGDDIDLF